MHPKNTKSNYNLDIYLKGNSRLKKLWLQMNICIIKSHILNESDKLCLTKTMVEDKNSQTHTAAVQHRIARRLNNNTEYSLTCGL